jgi:2-polyprenyl-6-methoxyphenol hydroxylase-like FAD-dependent oxidoreductase
MPLDANEAPVLISGGGPVGMGLAIELGLRGVPVILVERYPLPQPVPKGQNLTQRTMEHFHFWGAERELRTARTIPAEFGMGGLTSYGTLLGEYRYDWLQREIVRPFYYAENERLPQYATEAVLRARAAEIECIDIRYGWSVTSLSQDIDGVSLEITARDDGRVETLRGQYVVGCDGSRSVIRIQSGMTQTLSDHDKLMVLLVFRSAELSTLMSQYPGKCFFNTLHPDLKGYWLFFGRVGMKDDWFFHAPVPRKAAEGNYDFEALLRRSVGADIDVAFDHVGFWDLRFAIANQYRAGRAFIAGDAAHSHPPYGGYGVNSGFEDARNLGWKLAATLQGWGGDNLLSSYHDERHGVFASTAKDFIEHSINRDRDFLEAFDPARDRAAFEQEWSARASGARDEVNAFEPHYEGSPVVWSDGTPSAKGGHSLKARAGHHLAPQPLSGGLNVFEALGAGFTLIALDADAAAVAAFVRAADRRNLPLKIVRDDAAAPRSAYEAALILVRPDHFVAWAGSPKDLDAETILARAVGALPA